ncbi:polymer-forming cytoskeletal protein [Rhodospirillum sp. A1_3_36]|uniref:polymer-forming cytoskeletal protein n=1 Tax=Rhodospirillum sp. A1_3_36 TaxID=3391666 RepID=UPI0039A4E189
MKNRNIETKNESQGNAGLAESAQPSYFGPDLVVCGHVVSQSPLYISGRVEGDVECAILTLTSEGMVTGAVRASAVRLESGARLSGAVEADSIGVKGDASLTGRVVCRARQGVEAVRGFVQTSNPTHGLAAGAVGLVPAE